MLSKTDVWFQKIPIPTPLMIIGNSEGVGGLKGHPTQRGGVFKVKINHP